MVTIDFKINWKLIIWQKIVTKIVFENIFYLDNSNPTEALRIFLLVLKYLFTLQLRADLDDIKIGQ